MKTLAETLQAEWRPAQEVKEYEMILTEAEKERALHREFIRLNEYRLWKYKQDHNFSTGDFHNVPLTEEEKEKTIQDANRMKHLKIAHEATLAAKSLREAKELAQLHDSWTAAAFLKLMRTRSAEQGKKLLEDEYRLPLIKALCFRLSNDPRYETELGYSFKKGLIIRGMPGIGKSYPIQLLADNPINNIQIITMAEITASVMETGEYRGTKFGDYKIIYFDDVGTEYDGIDKIKHYGSEINWFKTYIEEYYARYQKAFHRLMFTTNDSFDVLQSKYGYRVRSRLAEMFDLIDVFGNDLRKT